jgi:hypothetical protein
MTNAAGMEKLTLDGHLASPTIEPYGPPAVHQISSMLCLHALSSFQRTGISPSGEPYKVTLNSTERQAHHRQIRARYHKHRFARELTRKPDSRGGRRHHDELAFVRRTF